MAQAFSPGFANDPQVIVFASGVSYSREIRAEQFTREKNLLKAALAAQKFILYFSTCSVYDPELAQSPYVRHKIEMEQLVCDGEGRKAIWRLPQVVGRSTNPHTLTNYLYRQISTGAPFQVWLNARRNLIDVCDVVNIVNHMVREPQADSVIMDIACPFSVSVLELVKIFEAVLDKKANYDTVAAGGEYTIDAGLAIAVAAKAGVAFDDQYVNNLIRKYYA
jgi:nucleoside-diphosphate-sugar epimerase